MLEPAEAVDGVFAVEAVGESFGAVVETYVYEASDEGDQCQWIDVP